MSLGPRGVLLPKPGTRVEKRIRNAQRSEIAHLPFEGAQELPAGRQIVIHNVQNLALHALHQPCHHYGLRTVINVSERNLVAASQMQISAERIQTDSRVQSGPGARTVNRPRADDHVWETVILFVIADQFILPKLAVAVGIMSAHRVPLHRAGLIKDLAAGQAVVRVNRE